MAEDIELNYVRITPNSKIVSRIHVQPSEDVIDLREAILKIHPEESPVFEGIVNVWKFSHPLQEAESLQLAGSIVPGQGVPNARLLPSLGVLSDIFADPPPPGCIHILVHV